MATFTITNNNTPTPRLKGFSVNITKLCTRVNNYPTSLYHNGENSYPVVGDTIYYYDLNVTPSVYRLFNNNTAALPSHAFNYNLVYIITNNNGVVINIKYC